MSNNFKADLVADIPCVKTGSDNAETCKAKLSLAGNDHRQPFTIFAGNEKSAGLYVISDNDVVASPLPLGDTGGNATNQSAATGNASDTATDGKKSKVLKGGIEHLEGQTPSDLYPANAQKDNQEAPKPTVFYKMQAAEDDTFGQQYDDKFMSKVTEKLRNKIGDLMEQNKDQDFAIPIPQGSEIYITCDLDRKANVSNLKVEHSSNCQLFDQLLLQSVNEVSGDKDLYFPQSITENKREEDCSFDLRSVEIKRLRNGVSADVLIGGSSRH